MHALRQQSLPVKYSWCAFSKRLLRLREIGNICIAPNAIILAVLPSVPVLVCSGPLPSNVSGVAANGTKFFPALRAMNISHNAFSGSLPAAFGQSGIFNLKPLQFADGEILMHVFDISYNQLSGPLPSFLDFTNVPEYAQRGIFISVSPYVISLFTLITHNSSTSSLMHNVLDCVTGAVHLACACVF